jgi:hypothetical protein
MGYPTKVQLIKRKNSRQFYISFPSALAQSMEFKKGELVEWVIKDKNALILKRVKGRR